MHHVSVFVYANLLLKNWFINERNYPEHMNLQADFTGDANAHNYIPRSCEDTAFYLSLDTRKIRPERDLKEFVET